DRLRAARFAHAPEPRIERTARFVRLYHRGLARSAQPPEAGRHHIALLHAAVGLARAQDLSDAARGIRRACADLRPGRLRGHDFPDLERSQLAAAARVARYRP